MSMKERLHISNKSDEAGLYRKDKIRSIGMGEGKCEFQREREIIPYRALYYTTEYTNYKAEVDKAITLLNGESTTPNGDKATTKLWWDKKLYYVTYYRGRLIS